MMPNDRRVFLCVCVLVCVLCGQSAISQNCVWHHSTTVVRTIRDIRPSLYAIRSIYITLYLCAGVSTEHKYVCVYICINVCLYSTFVHWIKYGVEPVPRRWYFARLLGSLYGSLLRLTCTILRCFDIRWSALCLLVWLHERMAWKVVGARLVKIVYRIPTRVYGISKYTVNMCITVEIGLVGCRYCGPTQLRDIWFELFKYRYIQEHLFWKNHFEKIRLA